MGPRRSSPLPGLNPPSDVPWPPLPAAPPLPVVPWVNPWFAVAAHPAAWPCPATTAAMEPSRNSEERFISAPPAGPASYGAGEPVVSRNS